VFKLVQLVGGLVIASTWCCPIAAAEVDFDTQVLPVLTRAGCNTGSCHGAAAGRGGLRLSLYGSNPALDHQRLVYELQGRRVNLAQPDSSLMLLKPSGLLDHGGGVRLDDQGEGYQLLLDWITAGAGRQASRHLVTFRVIPARRVLSRPGDSFTPQALATFSDGQEVDVTRWTVFKPEDDSAVTVSDEAMVTVKRRGQHVVLARYLDRVLSMQFIVPLQDALPQQAPGPAAGFVDEHVNHLLKQLHLPASSVADERVLVRRIYLDLAGRLPTPAEVRKYVEDGNQQKWEQLVDRLLASREFISFWTFRYASLLRIHGQPRDTKGAQAYHAWVRSQLSEGIGLDRWAFQLVIASGDSHQHGPANFYRTVTGPRKQAELFSELFMGVRLRCANCHDHPLDRWTQDDYHGLAAIFARIQSGRVVGLRENGTVTHPRTGQDARQRIPGGAFLESQVDARPLLAEWLTSDDNPYFARAMANRLWKAMMGRGLVEPTDDLRATNPASHPELMDELAADFARHGYDLRHTLRVIALSHSYRRSSRPLPENKADDRFYSHALVKQLDAEVLLDAISDVTGVAEVFQGVQDNTRAIDLVHAGIPSRALDVLGRCAREESCESAVDAAAGGLARRLHWLNGDLVNGRIADPDGRLGMLVRDDVPGEQIIEELYRRCFSRGLNDLEKKYWAGQLAGIDEAGERRQLLEDLFWSILSSEEFLTNH
jgi:hypothetical protein